MEEFINRYILSCKRKAVYTVKNEDKHPLKVIKEMFSEIKKCPRIETHPKFKLLDSSSLNHEVLSQRENALNFIANI